MTLLQKTMGKDFGKFFMTPEEEARDEAEMERNIDHANDQRV